MEAAAEQIVQDRKSALKTKHLVHLKKNNHDVDIIDNNKSTSVFRTQHPKQFFLRTTFDHILENSKKVSIIEFAKSRS